MVGLLCSHGHRGSGPGRLHHLCAGREEYGSSTGKEAAQGKSRALLPAVQQVRLLEPVCARAAAPAGAVLPVSAGGRGAEVFTEEFFYCSGNGPADSLLWPGLTRIKIQPAYLRLLLQILPADLLDCSGAGSHRRPGSSGVDLETQTRTQAGDPGCQGVTGRLNALFLAM